MSRERLLDIARLAEEHDLLVISDEIYDRLVYGVEHTCFASLPGMRQRTILLGGFSKAYAMTGWRIGYAAAPAEILGAMRKVHQYTIMSAPTMAQFAALEALRHGEEAVQEMRARYDRRRRLIVDGLNSIGLTCFEPRGAFYAFPSIAVTGMSDEEFSERLLHGGKGSLCARQRLWRLRRGARALLLRHRLRPDRTGPGADGPLCPTAWLNGQSGRRERGSLA